MKKRLAPSDVLYRPYLNNIDQELKEVYLTFPQQRHGTGGDGQVEKKWNKEGLVADSSGFKPRLTILLIVTDF